MTGDPVEEILDTAKRHEASMFIMTRHGRGALGRLAFGSVADRISRTAPIPVALVPPRDDLTSLGKIAVSRLIMPLDGLERAAWPLPVVTPLARQLEIPVQIIGVVDLFKVAASTNSGELFNLVISDMREGASAIANGAIEQLKHDKVSAQATVAEGSPADSIVSLVHPGDMIVMTSHGRGGLRR